MANLGGVGLSSENITQEPILQISGVSKHFGAHQAVKDVSIIVHQGEFLTLLGPSGCGKTTLLRMVAGFETPTSGEIRIAGTRVNEVPPYNRAIGMVFQNLALFPHLSVKENVGYGLRARRMPSETIRQEVAKALNLLDLGGFEDRYIQQLSGGQRQRVALARALVIGPDVLLLDEPLSALDLKLRRQLQLELKRIQQRVGTTFIFVTHDQEEALTMSDRIAVMNGGRVEQLGTPQAVYSKPASPFVAQFVGDSNFLTGQVTRKLGDTMEVEVETLNRTVVVNASTECEVGQRVGLSIRPEHIRISSKATNTQHSLQGIIQEHAYVGANTRYSISTETQLFVALVPNTSANDTPFKVQQTVSIDWSDEDAALVVLEGIETEDARKTSETDVHSMSA